MSHFFEIKKPISYANRFSFAEKEGFEPPDLLQSTVFKTAAFDRSAISPINHNHFLIAVANIVTFFGFPNRFTSKKNYFFQCFYNHFILFNLRFKIVILIANIFCNFKSITYHSNSFGLFRI